MANDVWLNLEKPNVHCKKSCLEHSTIKVTTNRTKTSCEGGNKKSRARFLGVQRDLCCNFTSQIFQVADIDSVSWFFFHKVLRIRALTCGLCGTSSL